MMHVASPVARYNLPIPHSKPRFSAFICNTKGEPPERCSKTGVRIFKFELTNDTSKYPLGQVVCPGSGFPGKNHFLVALASFCLPAFELISKEWRLKVMRFLIRTDSKHWEIGPKFPGDLQHEILADRGARLLQESTADVFMNKNGKRVMVMDYDQNKKVKDQTQFPEQKEPPKKEEPSSSQPTNVPHPQNSPPSSPSSQVQQLSAGDMQALMASYNAMYLQLLQHYQQCPQVQHGQTTQAQAGTAPLKTERQPSFA